MCGLGRFHMFSLPCEQENERYAGWSCALPLSLAAESGLNVFLAVVDLPDHGGKRKFWSKLFGTTCEGRKP